MQYTKNCHGRPVCIQTILSKQQHVTLRNGNFDVSIPEALNLNTFSIARKTTAMKVYISSHWIPVQHLLADTK